jgi:Uma2 family endonuclease
MDVPAPAMPSIPCGRITAEQYLRLVDDGVLGPDDRVELLEGVVVSMAAQNSPHASGVARASHALMFAVAKRAVVRTQLTFVAGEYSVPEPDIAIVPGRYADYDRVHPQTALLIVEVADTSLAQDRLTKAAIYAAAGIPEYWIVDVRGQRVEVYRQPVVDEYRYATRSFALRADTLEVTALPGAVVAVDDLLPVVDG